MGDVIATVERLREALRKLEEAAEEHLARDNAAGTDGPGDDGKLAELRAENARLSQDIETLGAQLAAMTEERDALRAENRKLSAKQTDVLKRLDSVIEQVEAAMNGDAAARV